MNTTSQGRNAEASVASLLVSKGHSLLASNWRTRWCEIDLVTSKNETVYFTEVKYRSSELWGGGFDYIGKKKEEQMRFAAELWIATNKWKGDAVLQAAEVNAQGEIILVEL